MKENTLALHTDILTVNRMCLSLIARNESISIHEADSLMDEERVIDHLNKRCKDLGINWNIETNRKVQEEVNALYFILASTASAYGADPHLLTEDCNGYLYIAAVASGCMISPTGWEIAEFMKQQKSS